MRLLNYKGHNHAVIRLQLELLGYWFTIVSRTGDLLMEDADYFSRMGEDIHSNPLMSDYLSFQRQLYDDNAPDKGEVNDQNTPGRRSKKARFEEVAEPVDPPNKATIELANIDWHQQAPVDVTTEHDVDRQLLNLPIQFTETGVLQSASRLNFSFMATTTQLIHKFSWCIHQPGHGHFLEQSRHMAIPYSMAIAAESDAAARSTLQTEYSVPVIVEKLSDLLNHCQSCKLPTIDGYYGRIEQETNSSAARQVKLH
jgi:hypothetical protein